MKRTSLLLFSSILLFALAGCSGNDKDRATASAGSMPWQPNQAAGAEGASGDQQATAPRVIHAAANGGLSLRASTPYAGSGQTTQNLNAGPFLTAAEERGSKAGEVFTSPTYLTARADGTMYGPTDHAAAGVGAGMVPASGGGAGSGTPPAKARTGGNPQINTKPTGQAPRQ